MQGFILAGGYGKRLYPLTSYINKTLIPIYDKAMVEFPYQTLKDSGVDEIYIVCQKKDLAAFACVFGEKVGYIPQDNPRGIASVFSTIKRYVRGNFALILGDNIFENALNFEFGGWGKIFLKEVEDYQRFGIAEFDGETIKKIHEKPEIQFSNLAAVGAYAYSPEVIPLAETLGESSRGEMEITDLNNILLNQNALDYGIVPDYWKDAGTFESLFDASLWRKKQANS
jgi:glucose-1-phosphate thymidylyltransferase